MLRRRIHRIGLRRAVSIILALVGVVIVVLVSPLFVAHLVDFRRTATFCLSGCQFGVSLQ